MVKWISIVAATAGVLVALWAVQASRRDPPSLPPVREPAVNPYPHGIAASGLVEASSRNVRVAPPEGGVVWEVAVEVNDHVEAGDLLFSLDPRLLEAELLGAQAAIETSQQQLARLQAMPRAEDVLPLRAAVQRAEAQHADARRERKHVEDLRQRRSASEQEMFRAQLAEDIAMAGLAEAQASLDRMLAGAWEADLQIARANLEVARAQAAAIAHRLDRLQVRAPIAGVILKRYIEPGEYVAPGHTALQLGDLSTLHVRAQVDERDTQLLEPEAEAIAVFAGRSKLAFDLRMLSIEPLAMPKSALSGLNTELVDTRVVEVLFAVLPDEHTDRLYPGQLVDVFIHTQAPVTDASTPR